MKHNKAFLSGMFVVPLALLGIGIAFASNVVTPNNFVANTPAMADEVNANFSAHADAINDNDARINTLQDPHRPGTLLAHVNFDSFGNLEESWVSTNGAVTVTWNGPGDYIIEIAGENLAFRTHLVTATPVNISNQFYCTFADADSAGYVNGIRIRVWDETGAPANAFVNVGIFNL